MIKRSDDCYGCGGCAAVCPKNAIRFGTNAEGFYRPEIDANLCVQCGLCDVVCPMNGDVCSRPKDRAEIQSFAGWSLDPETRFQSTTAGVCYELGLKALSEGRKVCGAIYDAETKITKHIVAEDVEALKQTRGSKYAPSDASEAFRRVFKERGRYVVVGTPCQIDAVRRYIQKVGREDEFLLVDFFCHGVPSQNLVVRYVEYKEARAQSKIVDVAWRTKANGWRDSLSMALKYRSPNGEEKVEISSKKKGDLFHWCFLKAYCLSPCCYDHCKYKMFESAADIRVGDLWGKTYSGNNDGVNGILTFSEKGRRALAALDNLHLEEVPASTAAEGQMKVGAKRPWGRDLIVKRLQKKTPLNKIIRDVKFVSRVRNLIRKILK